MDTAQGEAQRIVQHHFEIIDSIRNEYKETVDENELLEGLELATQQAHRSVNQVFERAGNVSEDQQLINVSIALNSISALDAEVDALEGYIEWKVTGPSATGAYTQIRTWWNRVKQVVKSAIKAISAQLWRIISHVLRLKEWSIKGSAGSSIFGLASAEITLSFGQ